MLNRMSAAPLDPPPEWLRRLMSVEEYLALGETEFRTELVEGQVTVSPSPTRRHQRASLRLAMALERSAPAGYEVVPDVDVDLGLAPRGEPGYVRAPDVVVVSPDGSRRLDEEGGTPRAADVVLVVEIVSPGSSRMDRVTKRDEYADAGIPHYWIIDLDPPISVTACHQAGELGYADNGEVTGTFRTTAPFPFELELSSLL